MKIEMRVVSWVSLIVLAILVLVVGCVPTPTPTPTPTVSVDRTIAARLTVVDDEGTYSDLYFSNSTKIKVSDLSIAVWNKTGTGNNNYKVNSYGIDRNVSMTYNFHCTDSSVLGTFYDLVSVTP